MPLAVDGAAVGVLLLVDHALFAARDVPAVDGGIGALFGADRPVVGAQLVRLGMGQLAVANALVDAGILVAEPAVDLRATGMVLVPGLALPL